MNYGPKEISLINSYFQKPGERYSIYQMVFPLVALTSSGEPKEILGSCFPIAKGGLFATAAHVFPAFQQLKPDYNKPEILKKKERIDIEAHRVGIFRFQKTAENDFKHELLTVDAAAMFVAHDVAFLFVDHGGIGSNTPILQLHKSPKKGDLVKIIGYGAESNKVEKGQYKFTLTASDGEIINEHPEGLQKSRIWYPCLESNAQMTSGQSGGPAINMKIPAVLGINSRSIDRGNSYISWLSKILNEPFGIPGWEIQISNGGKVSLDTFTISQLAAAGLLKITE